MFVILLTYQVPLSEIDAARPAHLAWLDVHYAAGTFLVSGPQVPRTGGVIVAQGLDREALMALLAQDPFHQQGLVTYEVIAFSPFRHAACLEPWLAKR